MITDLGSTAELGFSAQSVIDWASQAFTTTLAWQSTPAALGPETGESALTIEVEHGIGEVRILRPVPAAGTVKADLRMEGPKTSVGSASEPGVTGCLNAFEIDVQLGFRTDDGSLDERVAATLLAQAPQIATFRQSVDYAALQGSLAAPDIPPEHGKVKEVTLDGALSPLGTYGVIGVAWEKWFAGGGGAGSAGGAGGAGVVHYPGIAHWPGDDVCPQDVDFGLTVTADTDLGGYTGTELIERLNALFPRTLTWQVPTGESTAGADQPRRTDGSQTSLSLVIEAAGDGCARYGMSAWTLALPVTVRTETDDGSWQGEFTGELTTWDEATGLSQVQLWVALYEVPVDSFEAETGLSGVDLDGYEHGRMTLSVLLDVPDAGSSKGTLTAQGVQADIESVLVGAF